MLGAKGENLALIASEIGLPGDDPALWERLDVSRAPPMPARGTQTPLTTSPLPTHGSPAPPKTARPARWAASATAFWEPDHGQSFQAARVERSFVRRELEDIRCLLADLESRSAPRLAYDRGTCKS
jgi:hypothetical protein